MCNSMQHAAVANKLRILPSGLASSRCVCSGCRGLGEGPVYVCGQMGSVAEAELASRWAMGHCAQLVSLTGDSRKIHCLEAKGHIPSPTKRCQCPLLEVEGGAGFAKRVGWGRNDSLGKTRPCSQLQLPCSKDLARITDADSVALCSVLQRSLFSLCPVCRLTHRLFHGSVNARVMSPSAAVGYKLLASKPEKFLKQTAMYCPGRRVRSENVRSSA